MGSNLCHLNRSQAAVWENIKNSGIIRDPDFEHQETVATSPQGSFVPKVPNAAFFSNALYQYYAKGMSRAPAYAKTRQ
ncbi:hypothetical protein [Phaeobacter sp. C3_T13_0]|uniref:hypothetical protein n=1 Tax=Phaeobacter cretensis TaxID=3342641 RepID=UPI0039BCD049